jgi:ribonuclease HI
MPTRVKTNIRGETIASLLALRYYKDATIYTDCKPAMEYIQRKYPKYYNSIKWVPRGENKVADKLSKFNANFDISLTDNKGVFNNKTKKFTDLRNYIATQPIEKKITLYRKFAKVEWEHDFIDGIEKHHKSFTESGDGLFKYKGKFLCNTKLIKLIWNTNTHKDFGKGFFSFMRSRGQNMDRQCTSKEFSELLDSLNS